MKSLKATVMALVLATSLMACDEGAKTPPAAVEQTQTVKIGEKNCKAYFVKVIRDRCPSGAECGARVASDYLWYIDCGNGEVSTERTIQVGKTSHKQNVVQSSPSTMECVTPTPVVSTPMAQPVFECIQKKD